MFIRTDQRGHRFRRLLAAPVGAVALVGLAACGSSTTASAASTGSAPTTAAAGADSTAEPAGDSNSAMSAYRSCLEENGVTLPSRGNRPPGGEDGTPPSGAPGAPGEGGGQGRQGGGGMRQAPPGVDEATWTKAQEACADLRPARPTDAPVAGS